MNKILFFLLATLCFQISSNAQQTSLNENFTTCVGSTLPTAWLQYSVVGSDTWHCNTAGNSGNCAYINGYSSSTNNANEDWLISPSLNLSAMTSPNLSFWSKTDFTGNAIELMVSNNYTGTGNPNVATWTPITVTLPAPSSNVWTLSQNINLTAYKSTPFRIAYKYTSTNTAATSWKIDDVNIIDGSMTNLSKKFINVGQCVAGAQTPNQTFSFTMSAISGTFTVNCTTPFQISKDGISYSNQLSYTNAAANIAQTVYVRLSPTVADKVYRNEITFVNNGMTMNERVNVLGTSMPDVTTLRVYSWNMRWFGSPTWCNCDTNLARANATQILKDINADVYCLQEIVSNSQVALIAASLGSNYAYTVSPFCTGAQNPSSGFYQNCQKLAYIYNTNKVQNIGNFGLLASTYPADTATNSAYYCWSSGRFPYIMKAVLTLNGGLKDTIIFADIHAKASDTQSDYDRRSCGVQKMTDSLNALFPGKKIMVIGDNNDYLEGTTVSSQTVSPYQYMFTNGFTGITLPSLYPGQATYVGSTNHIIDNIICTPNLKAKYIDSSFFIFTETNKYITDYVNTTSDHYPIMSYYRFNFPNAIKDIQGQTFEMDIQNPSTNTLTLYSSFLENNNHLKIIDITGKLLYQQNIMSTTSPLQLQLPAIKQGLYIVIVENKNGRAVRKWNVAE